MTTGINANNIQTKSACQCDGIRLPVGGSAVNFRNVVCIKYSSDIGQCQTQLCCNLSAAGYGLAVLSSLCPFVQRSNFNSQWHRVHHAAIFKSF